MIIATGHPAALPVGCPMPIGYSFQFKPNEMVAVANDELGSVWFWCPGCRNLHRATTKGATVWEFSGDPVTPTITPSILTTTPVAPGSPGVPTRRCHLFIELGQIRFLSDCWHAFAGKTVPLSVPHWIRR
jgi:hypothetical protein